MSRNAIINNLHTKEHIACYMRDRQDYLDAVHELYGNASVLKSLTTTTKVNVLLVLFAAGEYRFLELMHSYIDLPDMEKTCRVLDCVRLRNQLKRKLQTKSKVVALRKEIKQLTQLEQEHDYYPLKATLTKCRRNAVMRWTKSIAIDQLQYRAYLFKTDLWRSLADMCHLSPRRDFQLDWFLGYCFGTPAPEGSLVYILETVNAENFRVIYDKYELPYECIRIAIKDKVVLGPNDKAQVIQRESLKTVLWNWKELACPVGEEIFAARLSTSTDSQIAELTYGKLLDAILNCFTPGLKNSLIQVAEKKLQAYESNIEHPVAVLCDASSSMNVAINTSSIITSMLSVVSNAELQVFRQTNETITRPPKTVREAVNFAKTIRANGSTSPASSLEFYYNAKKAIKTFIVVTDEKENTGCSHNYDWSHNLTEKGFFAELYQRYIAEVYPAKLVFISFTDSNRDGDMMKALRVVLDSAAMELVTVHKIDIRNPDMNRLDYVLEQMSGRAADVSLYVDDYQELIIETYM
jgi:hypothetical protein